MKYAKMGAKALYEMAYQYFGFLRNLSHHRSPARPAYSNSPKLPPLAYTPPHHALRAPAACTLLTRSAPPPQHPLEELGDDILIV